MLLLHDFGEDVTFAEDFDFLTIDFDFGSAVLAEEDFIADDDTDGRAIAAFEQPTGADSQHAAALRFFLGGIGQVNPASGLLFGLQRFKVYGADPIPAGDHQVRMEFAYDGGGLGRGGDVTLFVDGEQVGAGRVEGTVPMLFSADETTDVGSDTATPVSDDYGIRDSAFTGVVRWVQIDIDAAAEDADHLISAEERFTIAMARQ